MNHSEISPSLRPRERLFTSGSGSLSILELLALLLGTGTRNIHVLQVSEQLLSKHGLDGLLKLTLSQLSREQGVGPVKASRLLAAFELVRRLPLERSTRTLVHNASDVFDLYHARFLGLLQEQFVVLFLDVRNGILGDDIVTTGTLTASLVHPREVFSRAITRGAHRIIVLHNHPSGDPSPSPEDHEVTRILEDAGGIVGIPLADHIILGHGSYYSFKDNS